MRKKKMQGNQPVEIAISDRMLSEAMDIHLSYSNCNGALVYNGDFIYSDSNDLPVHMHEFTCKKCHKVLLI